LTGTLLGNLDNKVLTQQRQRFVEAAQEAGLKVPRTPQGLLKLAETVWYEHEKNFHKYRKEFDSGIRKKEELTYAADRYLKGIQGINETPTSGSHRAWMRERVNRAREILAQEGIKMTNADLQATWWYPEKQLYNKLGARDNEALNMDYATAFKILAQQKGIDNATIQAALASLE